MWSEPFIAPPSGKAGAEFDVWLPCGRPRRSPYRRLRELNWTLRALQNVDIAQARLAPARYRYVGMSQLARGPTRLRDSARLFPDDILCCNLFQKNCREWNESWVLWSNFIIRIVKHANSLKIFEIFFCFHILIDLYLLTFINSFFCFIYSFVPALLKRHISWMWIALDKGTVKYTKLLSLELRRITFVS